MTSARRIQQTGSSYSSYVDRTLVSPDSFLLTPTKRRRSKSQVGVQPSKKSQLRSFGNCGYSASEPVSTGSVQQVRSTFSYIPDYI